MDLNVRGLAAATGRAAGAALAALAAVVYTISFAVVAYGGALTPFLDWGIGLILIGTSVTALLVGITSSTRSMIAHPQEAPLLLIVSASPSILAASTAAGAGAGSDAQFATFLAFLMCSTGLTGLMLILAGSLRLSFVLRYLPYPIIGGVIVSIGYLLVISSVSLVVERPVDIFTLSGVIADGRLADWSPWALGALILLLVARRLPSTAILPIGILAAYLAFRIFLIASGMTLAQAEAAGLLLGPFSGDGFLNDLSVGVMREVQWGVVLSHLPLLLVLAPVSALTCLIHIQAVCRVTGEEPDLDRDLIANGVANIAGAGGGNIVSFPAISTSVLAAQFGTSTFLVCATTAAMGIGVAVFGGELLGALPRGLLAMLILYLGMSMLVSTLVTEWRRLPARDMVPILAILAATISVGLFYGLAVGVALSMFLFVVSYARLPFLRMDTSLALRRSIVERGEHDRAAIEQAGRRVRILEISGYLFFGTAHALRQRVLEHVSDDAAPMDVLVLDFQSVTDMDASAISSLERTQRECREGGVDVHITGVPDFLAAHLDRFGFGKAATDGAGLHWDATLDDALERIEEAILADASGCREADAGESFLGVLAAAAPDLDLAAAFDTLTVADGGRIAEEGEPFTDIFVLLEGRAAAVIGADTPDPLVVARFEPGALIGEMAFYQGAARRATIVAKGTARVLRIEACNLVSGGTTPDATLAAFHRIAARHVSPRLDRTTKLLRAARISPDDRVTTAAG